VNTSHNMASQVKSASMEDDISIASTSKRPKNSDGGQDGETGVETERKCLVGGNEGWANVFQKVLTQNPKIKKRSKGKPLILVKAKKDAELEAKREKAGAKAAKKPPKSTKREAPMKIVDEDGNVVDQEEVPSSSESEESVDSDSDSDLDVEQLTKKELIEKLRQKKLRKEMGLVMPEPGNPYEKLLIRTATKGVVQLFNAVNKFQEEKRIKRGEDSSDDEDRRYKRGKFMEDLGKISSKRRKEEEEGNSSKWVALRDDFMMDSKMRDWDKQTGDSD